MAREAEVSTTGRQVGTAASNPMTAPVPDAPSTLTDEEIAGILRVAKHVGDGTWPSAALRMAHRGILAERSAREKAERETRLNLLAHQIANGAVHDQLDAMTARAEAAESRLRVCEDALREIAGKRCGVPGHSVAVDCGSSAAARRALAGEGATE